MSMLKLTAQSPQIYPSPHDIAISAKGDLLYVADKEREEIRVLVAANLDLLGEFGRGELSLPQGLDIAPAPSSQSADTGKDLLTVADTGNDRLVQYQVDGTHAAKVREITNVRGCRGVAIDHRRQLFATSFDNSALLAFQDDELVQTYEGSDDITHTLHSPHGIDWFQGDEQGVLSLADTGNDRVLLLDQDLSVRHSLGGRAYGFNQPKYVCAMAKANANYWLAVSDYRNNAIKLINEKFELIDTAGVDILDRPTGIAAFGDTVWVSDTFNQRILQFTLNSPGA